MAVFTVAEVCAATGGTLRQGDKGLTFAGVSTDSRSLKPGELFVALRGETFDGHQYVAQALEAGAAGVIVDSGAEAVESGTVILVTDTRKALQNLAAFHRRRFSIPIVAITGSNGKTTTKDLTAAALASRFRVLKTEGNFNNDIGLPLTLLKLTAEHEAAVVEMGMRGLGEIAELVAVAQPTAGIVTNVGETHIELLGSVENIARAKGELVDGIMPEGFVVLNADNPYVSAMAARAKGRIIFYGIDSPSQVSARQIRTQGLTTSFLCICQGEEFSVEIPAVGRHNVYNSLAAIAAARELGLTAEEITSGLASFQPSAMRQHIETRGSYTIINDAYNASPLSMASALETLREVAAGRTVAVLGDMLELGSVAEEAHSRIGALAAAGGASVVVTVGSLARFIAQAAADGGAEAVACETHGQAIDELRRLLKPGDTILVKGSRGMKMEQIMALFG